MSPDTPKKKTIYVDADEEITSIADKVRSANSSIIALVLPKRASVLQSSVNMKLLKRVADQNDKQLVLITSEASLMPLAGMTGLYVASSLSSKPTLPLPPDTANKLEVPEEAIPVDQATTVGDVVAEAATPETIEIDNSARSASDSKIKGSKKDKTKSKKGKTKVPNFNKFRILLFGGIGALLLLIVGWYWAYFIAPSAVITIKGETSNISVSFDMTADTSATSLDEGSGVIPAKVQEEKKSDTAKVPATGQKDKGTKATGSVSLSTSCSAVTPSIPAGTGISTNNLTYITSAATSLTTPSIDGQGHCTFSGKVDVTAQNPGDQYNVGAGRSFAVSGYSSVSGTNSAAFSGGTSQVVKVISASDIESAKQQLVSKQGSTSDSLKKSLKDQGYVGISDTFSTGTPVVAASPAVDSEAAEVTVTSATTYTMLGVKEDDLKTLIKKSAGDQIDTDKQAILSYGINDANYKAGTKKGTKTAIAVSTQVVAGPEINEATIKKDIAGKKRGEAEQTISARPGIKEVRIDTKPFWIYSVPKKEAKIKLVIQEANGSQLTP